MFLFEIYGLTNFMLSADKWKWFEFIFKIYNKNLLRRRFNSLLLNNINVFSDYDEKLPTIVYLNHSSWWDGLVIFEISKILNFDSFVMMEEKQLKRYFLFRHLGAFSVNRQSYRSALKSLEYCVKLIKETNKTLWIFPQGEILPNSYRPLHFYKGLMYIIEKLEKCRIVPLAIRYEFGNNYKPDILVKSGSSEIVKNLTKSSRKKTISEYESKLTDLLDSIETDLRVNNLSEFKNFLNL